MPRPCLPRGSAFGSQIAQIEPPRPRWHLHSRERAPSPRWPWARTLAHDITGRLGCAAHLLPRLRNPHGSIQGQPRPWRDEARVPLEVQAEGWQPTVTSTRRLEPKAAAPPAAQRDAGLSEDRGVPLPQRVKVAEHGLPVAGVDLWEQTVAEEKEARAQGGRQGGDEGVRSQRGAMRPPPKHRSGRYTQIRVLN